MKKDMTIADMLWLGALRALVYWLLLGLIWVIIELIVLGQPNPNRIDDIIGIIILAYMCWAEIRNVFAQNKILNDCANDETHDD